jgi:hypothetical protein
LQLFAAKSSVHAVFWNQLRDESGEPPGRGLIDDLGQPNSAMATLSRFRKRLDF